MQVARKVGMLDSVGQLRTDLEAILLRLSKNEQHRHRDRRLGPSLFHSIGTVTISAPTTFNMVNEMTFLDPSSDNVGRRIRVERAESLLQDILRYHWACSEADKIHEILDIIRGLAVNKSQYVH